VTDEKTTVDHNAYQRGYFENADHVTLTREDSPYLRRHVRHIMEFANIKPGDRVLEVGCGHGIAATMVCERLTTGRYTAIDRSRKMIEAAERRCAAHVAAGRAEFLVASFEDADLGGRRFDVIVAVRVGLFHRDPQRARTLAEQWLASGGAVHAFYDAPGG
jgi:cyclopropane fatty-acyl-phospholipid synthase-like methyltransferase